VLEADPSCKPQASTLTHPDTVKGTLYAASRRRRPAAAKTGVDTFTRLLLVSPLAAAMDRAVALALVAFQVSVPLTVRPRLEKMGMSSNMTVPVAQRAGEHR